jgi:hypothetical protein
VPPKAIFEPIIRLAQTVHQSCLKISTLQMDQNELLFEPHHIGVPSGLSKMIFEPMVSWAQIVQLTPTLTPSPNKSMRGSTEPMSLRSSFRCVQNDIHA